MLVRPASHYIYSVGDEYPVGLTGAGGALYGATNGTAGSGPGTCGTVFELLPPGSQGSAWDPVVLYSFVFGVGGPDACQPLAAPVVGTGGVLFGVTTQGGHFNTPLAIANGKLYGALTTGTGGSIFEMQPPSAPGGDWSMTTLYTFTNGQVPTGNLIAEPNGDVYGLTAAAPGQPSSGTVFVITMN